ncbi:MAG: lactate utilization protein [Chloroflexi bacterium]|nr:lactate utilization protein [Chloroflexota bacterium]
MNARESILNKLRAARQPFPDAPPRPRTYQPATAVADQSPDGLLARFREELERLGGEVFAVEGDEAAREKVLDLLRSHRAAHVLAWHFTRIPARGLRAAIEAAGITISQPTLRDETRAETLAAIRDAGVGLTGADAAIATTGTLVFSTAAGKGRIPTILPPVHIAVVTLNQFVPRLEDWAAAQRAAGLETARSSANVCFVSGPSKTGDIEMILVKQVHGPGVLQVVVKR